MVTSAESRLAHSCNTAGTVKVGTPITSISLSPNSAATTARLSSPRSIIPAFTAISTVEARREMPITSLARPFSRAAAAKLEPIRPKPTTTRRLIPGAALIELRDIFLPAISYGLNFTSYDLQHSTRV